MFTRAAMLDLAIIRYLRSVVATAATAVGAGINISSSNVNGRLRFGTTNAGRRASWRSVDINLRR